MTAVHHDLKGIYKMNRAGGLHEASMHDSGWGGRVGMPFTCIMPVAGPGGMRTADLPFRQSDYIITN